MESLIGAVFFLLGAVVASFVGLAAARYRTGQSIVAGRSHCDACGAPLPALSLVPVLSWVAGKGRAHCCGSRISALGPLSELALGALFALSYAALGFGSALPGMLIALSLLLFLVLYDLAHQILPPVPLAAFVGSAAASSWVLYPDFFSTVVPTSLILGGILLLLHLASRGRAMGFSDAPLAFGLSLLFGPYAISGFVFSFWIGAVIGIAVLFGRPRGSRMGIEVPFAPFLAAGFILAYFTQWNPFAPGFLLAVFG